MKKVLIFSALFLLASVSLSAQVVKGAGLWYFNGLPNVTPSVATGTEVAYSINNKSLFKWNRTTSAWVAVVQDSSITNELQDLILSGDTLSLTLSDSVILMAQYRNHVWEITNLSDTTSVIGDIEGDIAYTSTGDTIAFRGASAWLPFTGGGGGGTFNSFNIAGDTGSDIVTDGQTVTVAGGYGINTAETGGTVTVTADTSQLVTPFDISTFVSGAVDSIAILQDSIVVGYSEGVEVARDTIGYPAGATITASNGLTKTGTDMKLGGTLTANTTISGASTYDLDFSALDSLSLSVAKRFLITQNSQRFLHQTGGGLGAGVFENLFIGYQAGASALGTGQGYANTVIGRRAGYNLTLTSAGGLTTASSNVFLGYGAGEGCTNCTGNTFLGTASGSNSVSTYANVYVGWHAGINATGSYNTFLGREAGNSSTTSETVSVGYSAGRNTTGAGNTFLGSYAGETGTTARRNTYVGYTAGRFLSSGSEENTFVGFRAGSGAANVSAGYNTAVGSDAGLALTSGNTNTFLGRQAGSTVTTGSGNVYIGNNAQGGTTGSNNILISPNTGAFPTTTQSNSILIGPDIYATGTHTGLQMRMAVGNGTFRDPRATFHVRSYTKSVNDTIFCASASASALSTFHNFFITADGGFVSQQEPGVSTSGVPLARFVSSYTNSGTANAGWGTITVFPTVNETTLDTTWSYKAQPTLTSASDFISFWTNNNTGVGFASTGTATNYFRGKVGIGSGTYPTPARDLHVAGEVRITDLTTEAPTRFVGADADGDLGAITEGYGINITAGGAAEVDTAQVVTPSDLAAAVAAGGANLSLIGTTGTIELTNSAGTDIVYKTTGSNISLIKVSGTKDTLYIGTVEHWGEVSASGGSTSATAGTPERPDNDTPGTQTANLSSEYTNTGSQLNYIGAAGQVEVKGAVSFSPSATGDYLISIFQEGVELAVTEVRVTCTASEYITVPVLSTSVSVAANDTFDVRIEPVSGSATITVHRYNIYSRKIY